MPQKISSSAVKNMRKPIGKIAVIRIAAPSANAKIPINFQYSQHIYDAPLRLCISLYYKRSQSVTQINQSTSYQIILLQKLES